MLSTDIVGFFKMYFQSVVGRYKTYGVVDLLLTISSSPYLVLPSTTPSSHEAPLITFQMGFYFIYINSYPFIISHFF